MFGLSRPQNGSGLSINTTSANSLSASNQPQPSSGLFGANSQQEKPAGGLFGSSTSNPPPQQTSSLFASSTSNQRGGLLGFQETNGQQQTRGSLFGGQQAPSPGVGSFNPQATQQQSGGIFGLSRMGAGQSQEAIGPSHIQGQGQNTQSSGLFGDSGQNTTSLPFQNPALQSQSHHQQLQQPTQPSSIFSASIGQYSQQQQTIPGVRISINELRPTTRFNDLHEDLQKVIENVDNFIQDQIREQETCEQIMGKVEGSAASIPNDVGYCTTTLDTMQNALENDAETIAHTKVLIKSDAANAKLSFKIIQNLRLPQPYQHSGLWNIPPVSQTATPTLAEDGLSSSSDLVSYFSNESDNMSRTLEGYKKNLAEVEVYLKGIEVNTFHQMQHMAFTHGHDGKTKNAEDQVRELANVLREFEHGILGVAGKVGGVREKVQEVMLGESGGGTGRARRV